MKPVNTKPEPPKMTAFFLKRIWFWDMLKKERKNAGKGGSS